MHSNRRDVKDPQRKQETDERCLESCYNLCKHYPGINQALTKLGAPLIFIINLFVYKSDPCHNIDAFSKENTASYKVLKYLSSY